MKGKKKGRMVLGEHLLKVGRMISYFPLLFVKALS